MKTSVLQCGSGKDLLFLHGYGANKEIFLPQINYFSRFYKVTAFDFWGFGNSAPIPSAWSVGDYAEQTKRLLQELNIVRPHVVAHSFGARVAIKTASEDSDAFEKIILTGAAGIILNRGMGYRMKVGLYRSVKKLFPEYAEKRFGSAEYRSLSPLMRESYKKIVNEDLRSAAKAVRNPVLLVYGEKDKTTPVEAGKIYCSTMENGRMEILSRCGHFAFLDDVTSFNQITEEFLEK